MSDIFMRSKKENLGYRVKRVPRGILDICHKKETKKVDAMAMAGIVKFEKRRQSDGAIIGDEISLSIAKHIINECDEKLNAN